MTFAVMLITLCEQDSPNWNQTQLSRFQEVLDEFQQYHNTAGVFVGNEVLTRGEYATATDLWTLTFYAANGSVAAPYVKAALRDVKAYRDSKNYRKVPIGYSAGEQLSGHCSKKGIDLKIADIPGLRPMLQNYLACGDDPTINADFYSLNVYEWCGESSYDGSGYSMLEQNATSYNIPIFISETGCRRPAPRLFEDQASIFGKDMADTWSGAIIYEWIEEANDYGLVSYGPTVNPTGAAATTALDGYPRSGTPSPVLPDYTNLQNQWSTLTPTGAKLSAYAASTGKLSPPACPTSTASGWIVNGNAKLPSLGETLSAAATAATASPTTSAKPSTTGKGAAAGGKEIAGMGLGLMGVMLGFVVWL